MSRILSLTFWLTALSITVLAQKGQLVAFVNADSPIDAQFISDDWVAIKQLAEQYELDFQLIDVKEGVPSEITITPQLVFQNEKGRSFYVGRYSELDRLKVFLRSVRNSPKEVASNQKTDILIRAEGKSRSIIPIKITELNGSVPMTLDNTEFNRAAEESFKAGFNAFKSGIIDFSVTDRAFYVDMHPYLDENGLLYVSYEIYSQFNCVVPIFSKLTEPVTANFEDYKVFFKELGANIEATILNYTNSATNGDGYTPVVNPVSTSWEELGLKLTEYKEEGLISGVTQLENEWGDPRPIDQLTPLIQFNFFAPLDNYGGEATSLNGMISWKKDLMTGEFVVLTKSVTMGEQTYDDNVHKKYIKVGRFPEATISFEDQKISPDMILKEPGRIFMVKGLLSFMGKEKPIDISTSFDTFVNEQGTNQLIVTANFTTNIFDPFKVKGPDGPQRAKENMSFQAQFILSPNSIYNDNTN